MDGLDDQDDIANFSLLVRNSQGLPPLCRMHLTVHAGSGEDENPIAFPLLQSLFAHLLDDDEEEDDEPMEGQAKAKSSSKAKAQRAAQVHHPA